MFSNFVSFYSKSLTKYPTLTNALTGFIIASIGDVACQYFEYRFCRDSMEEEEIKNIKKKNSWRSRVIEDGINSSSENLSNADTIYSQPKPKLSNYSHHSLFTKDLASLQSLKSKREDNMGDKNCLFRYIGTCTSRQ